MGGNSRKQVRPGTARLRLGRAGRFRADLLLGVRDHRRRAELGPALHPRTPFERWLLIQLQVVLGTDTPRLRTAVRDRSVADRVRCDLVGSLLRLRQADQQQRRRQEAGDRPSQVRPPGGRPGTDWSPEEGAPAWLGATGRRRRVRRYDTTRAGADVLRVHARRVSPPGRHLRA